MLRKREREIKKLDEIFDKFSVKKNYNIYPFLISFNNELVLRFKRTDERDDPVPI